MLACAPPCTPGPPALPDAIAAIAAMAGPPRLPMPARLPGLSAAMLGLPVGRPVLAFMLLGIPPAGDPRPIIPMSPYIGDGFCNPEDSFKIHLKSNLSE